MTDTDEPPGMESAVAELYRGPLADFVRVRDGLAKDLRASGDRAAASAVKALRKPSRLAWALNLGVQNRTFTAFETAIAGTLNAQATGGDVRAAMAALREAVRSLAGVCAEAAERAGQQVEARALASALLAVISTPESFEQLRRGQLADVPDAGGLDFLASLPAPTSAAAVAESPQVAPDEEHPEDATARATALRAQATLASAQAHASATHEALRKAESELAAAEERARQADSELAAARKRRDSAQHDAETAAAELRSAETANTRAQAQLKRTLSS